MSCSWAFRSQATTHLSPLRHPEEDGLPDWMHHRMTGAANPTSCESNAWVSAVPTFDIAITTATGSSAAWCVYRLIRHPEGHMQLAARLLCYPLNAWR